MIAISIETRFYVPKYEIIEYKGFYYAKTGNKALPYIYFKESFDDESKIDEGLRYCYYHINGKLFEDCLTNELGIELIKKEIDSQKQVQLRLF